MPLNGVVLSRQTGAALVLADRQGGRWLPEPGVPFLAEVLEREDSRVLLAVAGRLLQAETALPLTPRARVWLAVKEVTPERVTLVPLPAAPDPGAAPLPPEPDVPLPPDQALTRAVAFLLAQGRPVTPEAVQSVAPFFAGTADLAKSLAALEKLLAQASAFGLVERLRSAIAAVHFRPDEGAPSELGARLGEAVQRLGLDYEVRLAAALLEEVTHSTGSTARFSAAAPSGGAIADSDLKGLLLQLQRVLADSRADNLGSAAPGRTPALAEEPAQVPVGRQEEAVPAGAARLAEAVDQALRDLTGQRLLVPAAPEQPSLQGQTPSHGQGLSQVTGPGQGQGQGKERLEILLQIPVAVGEQRHTAELRLYREAGGGRRSRPDRPAALRVSCRLATAHLGPVRVDLALRSRGAAEARLYLSSEPVLALFQAREGEFREALGQAGLRLGRVSYALGTPPAPPAKPNEADRPPAVQPGVLDLRL